ncbi:MAG: SpoIIE family protein phosphatase [Acidobacteria bacterium]|nr:SpoIIE family protein phosphatase [Acidobacteriota bacterium]
MTGLDIVVYPKGEEPIRRTLSGGSLTMGRSPDCSLQIHDRFLSRKHIELRDEGERWVLLDCGSANGTWLNGIPVKVPMNLRPGDSIRIGETEILFGVTRTDRLLAVESTSQTTTSAVHLADAIEKGKHSKRAFERTQALNKLAIELLEDRPLGELFDFILDRVVETFAPSRAALALFGRGHSGFDTIKVRRADDDDIADLVLSRTLLSEVVEEKKIVSLLDAGQNDKLSQAKSIVGQRISSALCAPLLVEDKVLGVLYVDFLMGTKELDDDDVCLVGQIARFAATKLDTTRLREESLLKQRIDEELRTAYVVQGRILPARPPEVPGYLLAGLNRPARMVSGDYYDFVIRPDGRVYFVIADVSGKGITAALLMSSLAMAFNIFASQDPSPSELVSRLNAMLAPRLGPAKFVTLFAGVIDPSKPGEVCFANAGHLPPLVFNASGAVEAGDTDIVMGVFSNSSYRDQTLVLGEGDSIVLFTDGVAEAENATGDLLGTEGIAKALRGRHFHDADEVVNAVDMAVSSFLSGAEQHDDVTILAITRKS